VKYHIVGVGDSWQAGPCRGCRGSGSLLSVRVVVDELPTVRECPDCGEPEAAHPTEDCWLADLATCAYYLGTGSCSFGCDQEPECKTSRPREGWPSWRERPICDGDTVTVTEEQCRDTSGGRWYPIDHFLHRGSAHLSYRLECITSHERRLHPRWSGTVRVLPIVDCDMSCGGPYPPVPFVMTHYEDELTVILWWGDEPADYDDVTNEPWAVDARPGRYLLVIENMTEEPNG
jgi:hypothetical protein